MSVNPTVAEVLFLVSNAQVWTALSIWRRLLMQAFFCDCVRARTKLGIAIAARRPMMATTIIISTNVKPDVREVLFFILAFVFLFRGVNAQQAGYYDYSDCSLIACCNRTSLRANEVPTCLHSRTPQNKRGLRIASQASVSVQMPDN